MIFVLLALLLPACATAGADKTIDALIIGGGSAGLASAINLLRDKRHTVIVRGPEPGGQLMGSSSVENIPGVAPVPGYRIIEEREEQLAKLGAHFIDGTVTSLERNPAGLFVAQMDTGTALTARTVILATGSKARHLEVPGERERMNDGVYTCAVCDKRQAADQHVVVVGGGDAAVEAVMHLAPYAKSIDLLVRSGALRAARVMQDKLALYEQVKVRPYTRVTEVMSQDNKLTGVMTEDTRTHERALTHAGALFLAIGHTPNSGLVKALSALDPDGYVLVDGYSQRVIDTAGKVVPGLFVAGDVRDRHIRQDPTATGEGVAAGIEAIKYLQQAHKG